MQLSKEDTYYEKIVTDITKSPIATAETILSLPVQIQSPKVRSAAAHLLVDAISSLAGIKDQRVRKMKWLFSRLCSRRLPPIPYPFTPLPPKNVAEELEDVIADALIMMPYLKHPDCTELATRCLMLMDRFFAGTPAHLIKSKRTFVDIIKLYVPGYDPTPEPSLFAQFRERKDIVQQLTEINAEARYQRALKLFNKPPEGNA
jgi:hypothetical protein